jgi:hypothetical protein
MNEKHLTNYMKDHFAGSVAAVELLNHLISSSCSKTIFTVAAVLLRNFEAGLIMEPCFHRSAK